MTAPTLAPALPRNDFAARLQYQVTANRLVLGDGPVAPGALPVFTAAELEAMDFAYTAGITPAAFVETVQSIRSQP